MLGGTTSDGAEWVTAFGIDDRDIQMTCIDITVEGEAVAPGVLGGPFRAGSEPGEVVVSVLITKPRADHDGMSCAARCPPVPTGSS